MCDKPAINTVYQFTPDAMRSVLAPLLNVPPNRIELMWDLEVDEDSSPDDPSYVVTSMTAKIVDEIE
jgi:hypothetical protein